MGSTTSSSSRLRGGLSCLYFSSWWSLSTGGHSLLWSTVVNLWCTCAPETIDDKNKGGVGRMKGRL
ncbi:Thiamine transporter 2 [Sesbania bispinosa]|nr:Thiamine transporter 2 [Sesbania bispinosa]